MIRVDSALLSAFLLAAPLMPQVAHAADVEDLDSSGETRKPKKTRTASSEVIREVVRGVYAKAGAGSTIYLLTFSPTLQPGTGLSLGVGQDFVDQEHTSMAWEIEFNQAVHNGLLYQLQPGNVPPQAYVQGDTRTFNLLANYEFSFYPSRRFGIGFRAGAGVGLAPLIVDKQAYQETIVGEYFGGIQPAVHNTPHPLFFGGPTFEYYTKLSHFSVGLDADVSYALGLDLGVMVQGYMKFTFSRPADRRKRDDG